MHVLISIPNISFCIILSLQFYSILLRVPPYLCPLLARLSDHTPTRAFFIAQRIVQMLTKWSQWSKIQILLRQKRADKLLYVQALINKRSRTQHAQIRRLYCVPTALRPIVDRTKITRTSLAGIDYAGSAVQKMVSVA